MPTFKDYTGAREQRREMVNSQLRNRGIHTKAILNAFLQTPRHYFVDAKYRDDAYSDQPLPLDHGQTISQPYVVALMLEYLEVSKQHDVLEIGGGSGYAAAILAQLSRSVLSIEVFSSLISKAEAVVRELGIQNLSFEHGSAWEQSQPGKVYDRIILWASPPRLPEYLIRSLKPGGRLVAPEGKLDQHVWIYSRHGDQISREKRDSVRFVPLLQGTTDEIDMFR